MSVISDERRSDNNSVYRFVWRFYLEWIICTMRELQLFINKFVNDFHLSVY